MARFGQCSTSRREKDLLAQLLEQGLANVLSQLLDLQRQGGGCEMQRLCRPSKTVVLSHGLKDAQLMERGVSKLHKMILCGARLTPDLK